jgi:hypothetical protein
LASDDLPNLCVVSKFQYQPAYFLVQVVDVDGEEQRPQQAALGDSRQYLRSFIALSIQNHPLFSPGQPGIYPGKEWPINPVGLEFFHQSFLGHFIKCFGEVQVHHVLYAGNIVTLTEGPLLGCT